MLSKLYTFIFVLVVAGSFTYAGSFELQASGDKMDIGEEMGDVLAAITSAELSELKSGETQTKEGKTKFNQYLRFQDTTTAINGSSIFLTKDDNNNVDTFLNVDKGFAITDAFFEYHLEFETGLKSKIVDKRLKGLEDAKFSIFDEEYLIVDATEDNKRITLTIASGAISDFLSVGETKEYTIGTNKYEISVKTIETNTKAVIFTINGKDLQKLVKSETVDLGNGLTLGVIDVLLSSGGNDIVQFFIGAKLLQWEDNNYEDDSFNKGVKVNKNKIEDAFIKISANLVNDILKISDIKYRAVAKKDIYAKAGEGIVQHLVDPAIMLGNWDIIFTNLNTPTVTKLQLVPSGSDDEYRLTFTNADGQEMTVPFISNKNSFKLGDVDQNLVIVEGGSSTSFNVGVNDYFILTTSNSKTGKTYAMKYNSIDTVAQTLTFEQVGAGTKAVQYTNSSTAGARGEASLTVGSITSKIFVSNETNSSLAVDLDGDGSVGTTAVDIVVKGGGVLDPGATNTPSLNYAITLTTDSSQFEETSSNEVITITFEDPSGTPKVGIQTTFGGLGTESTATNVLGLSGYGVRSDLLIPSGKANTLTLDYPSSQAFASVAISVGAGTATQKTSVTEIKVSSCTNGKQDGDETDVDCGGSCPSCPSCSDGLQNQREEGTDCGGPCPNACEKKEEEGKCPNACMQILGGEEYNCLNFGGIVNNLYCDTDQTLKVQKRNGEACKADYECLRSYCSGEGICGKKITVTHWVINGIIIILIMGILWYAFTLLKSSP